MVYDSTFLRQSDFVRVDEVHKGEKQNEVIYPQIYHQDHHHHHHHHHQDHHQASEHQEHRLVTGEGSDLLCERRVQQGDLRQLQECPVSGDLRHGELLQHLHRCLVHL